MSHLIEHLFQHHESRLKRRYTAECAAALFPHIPLEDIHFAQPSLSAWATYLLGNRIYNSVGTLAHKNRDDSKSHTHIRASTNGKDPNAQVVSWEDTHFTIEGLAQKYVMNTELVWYLTECMAAPRKKGVVVIHKRHPHPVVSFELLRFSFSSFFSSHFLQVTAISLFIPSCNQYASDDLALPLHIWHFVCESHINVKHVYCVSNSLWVG
ncbi:hypothetical protein DFH08DRAFT_718892 [Mycena albidolilacea]|uniref:Uncharacterized protein n=1 Tax=Mycena albidolilacea TaxID=1033008 RepID=A0AAD6Z7P6_9AGAR|nr:hypothetical protein DFH08DRAFT_718892 [Mycena albidolilacea]